MATKEVLRELEPLNAPNAAEPSLPEAFRSIDTKQRREAGCAAFFHSPGRATWFRSVIWIRATGAPTWRAARNMVTRCLWVILASNLMAMLLQTLCARLGLVTGKDLAQACRDYYKKPVAIVLWLLCEIAIIACDLAEVIGSAVALNLLFHIPLLWGVLLTGFDVLILLGMMSISAFAKLKRLSSRSSPPSRFALGMEIFLRQAGMGQRCGGPDSLDSQQRCLS